VVRSVAGTLEAEGLDVLLDDRPGSSAGVKFADADLIGCPVQVVIGRRAAEGVVELRARDRSVVTEINITDLSKAVERLRRGL
jgi:prolyl-tRNA synthetase